MFSRSESSVLRPDDFEGVDGDEEVDEAVEASDKISLPPHAGHRCQDIGVPVHPQL